MKAFDFDPLVNGRFLARPLTGVDRFAIEMLSALTGSLTATQPASALRIAVPTGATVNGEGARLGRVTSVGRRSGHAWEQLELSGAAGGNPLLNLCNTAPLTRRQQLVVIHDAATVANPSNYGVAFRNWYRLMHAAVMRLSRVVMTVSNFSADELARIYGRRSRGIEVVAEGGEHILRHAADERVLDRLGVRDRTYVLAVGSRSPNKNFQAVLDAVMSIDDPNLLLVVAGGSDSRVFNGAIVSDPRLRLAGYVSDAELRALYEAASCFAFPSFYEGFGLPPLEAMCCGCPVIVSNRSALPETCSSAALYCDPDDSGTLATQIRALLASAQLRSEMREAGFARARNFGWARTSLHFRQVLDANF